MEYLSRVLMEVQSFQGFKYHSLCRRLHLAHLCFADDLFMFCYGNVSSVSILMRGFLTFSRAFGLVMNKQKSCLYANGIEDTNMQRILLITGISRGGRVPVPWFHFVWNKIALPKHSFISWLLMNERLLTKSRPLRLGAVVGAECPICDCPGEDQRHLFFTCVSSARCLSLLALKFCLRLPPSKIDKWWSAYRFESLFHKKVVGAIEVGLIYQIWTVRNHCLHEGIPWRSEVVVKRVIYEVIVCCRHQVSNLVLRKYQNWLYSLL
ncbi:hypothetical protein RND81_08G064600 [Saponaria officinalis]|uniref:Reverse transcriptase zinc-binding domain-containing protein n=1 Tax=Saponaria officinalis TaxID=3572 RepID=A0AAW1J4R2_SAPOF